MIVCQIESNTLDHDELSMIEKVFFFIKINFSKMPRTVQILTYLGMVFVFITLVLSPNYIDIRLVGVIDGQHFPVAEARVEIETEDRVIIMMTDKRGRFSVPIGLAHPVKTYKFILYPDSKTMRQIDIEVGGYMAYKNWNKLQYSNKKDEYKFVRSSPNTLFSAVYANDSEETLEFVSPLSLTINETLDLETLQKEVPVVPFEVSTQTEIMIEATVINAVAKAIAKKPEAIKINTELSGDLALGNYERSYVTYKVKEKLNIDLSDSIWGTVNTPKDIIDMSTHTFVKDKSSKKEPIDSVEQKRILIENLGDDDIISHSQQK